MLFAIIEQADPPAGKASELKKLASGYANLNRLPSMEELYPSNGNGYHASPPPINTYSSTTPHNISYNGPLPHIPSLTLPAPNSAKERLQVFVADIFGRSSSLFDQIDFIQARAGASPWSIILCQREYTSQYIYREKDDGQEAAVRVALEKGALSVLLKEHEPQPQYHAAAIDLIAKFSQPHGLYPLPPPIGKNPGSRTPIPGQAGSATPLYMPVQNGGASPYHPSMSIPPMSPYHAAVVPMSPYHSGYVSDAMYASASGRASPHHHSRGRSSSRRHASRSRSSKRSSSKHRSSSKYRSSSKHRSKSRHRSKARRERSDSASSREARSNSITGSASDTDDRPRRGRKRKNSRADGGEQERSKKVRSSSRRGTRQRSGSVEGESRNEEYDLERTSDRERPLREVSPRDSQPVKIPGPVNLAQGNRSTQTASNADKPARDINLDLSEYLDYLLDCLEPGNASIDEEIARVKEESPEPSSMFQQSLPQRVDGPTSHGRLDRLLKQLDSGNRQKLELVKEACAIALSMQKLRQAAIDEGGTDAEAELVLMPRRWVEDALELFKEPYA